jgi:hypothetical protein
MTLAGLKGISRSCSELSLQLRIVSTSASTHSHVMMLNPSISKLTLNVEFVAISDGAFQENSDGVRKSLDSLVAKGGKRVDAVLVAFDLDVLLYLREWVCAFHLWIGSVYLIEIIY